MAPKVIGGHEDSSQKHYLKNNGRCQQSGENANRDTDTWNSELYSKEAAYVSNGVGHLIDLLQPQPGLLFTPA